MRQYLVVAHRTLGGAHLIDHLRGLAADDPSSQFHIVVPRYHPLDQIWSDGTTQAIAQQHLDEMLEMLVGAGLKATGQVGSSNPVKAIGEVLGNEGVDSFSGCVLSTLPSGISSWLRSDVPSRVTKAYPSLPLTHLIAVEETVV